MRFGELPTKLKKRNLAKKQNIRLLRKTNVKTDRGAVVALKSLGAEDKIIRNLRNDDLGKIFSLWNQNIRRVGDPKQSFKHAAAKRIILAVENEWDRRLPYIRLKPDQFIWPSTEANIGNGSIGLGASPETGMLSYLEYRVGNTNGQPLGIRRVILDRVVNGTLPLYGGLEYYEQWGRPGSAARLKKLAEAIAAFTRNAKRRGKASLSDAISEWESDLDYLYSTYYVPQFGFGWPLS